ncbi:double zinc ribbon [Oxobacter pfennigii]|uniref:Double zinc ribbon n=1 Tax=Oxobacter pfennigii TaxID=36849 RepID=A0A0P8YTF9_9CLOT|nr:zinc ribbon domain-containing protein [Oxobacter pfennigii]KPU42981.1 double zinc ribbon [Oxobacter pfennigii]
MSISIIAILIYMIIIAGIPAMIGFYVYRDAVQRGMNGGLWTLIVVLTPGFIGFIIYLLVRGSYSDLKCPNCLTQVNDQYGVCPKCGTRLKASCPNCNFPAEPDWKVCPRCASPLPENDGAAYPIRTKDNALGKILLAVVVIPLILLMLLVIFNLAIFRSTSAMNIAYLSIEDYKGRPEVTEWIKACNEDPSKTYALRYQSEYNEKKATHYLIYRPSAGKNTSVGADYKSGLFGANIEARFYEGADLEGEENHLTCISNYSDKFAGLKVFLKDKKIDCEITEVDYNPALFEIISE